MFKNEVRFLHAEDKNHQNKPRDEFLDDEEDDEDDDGFVDLFRCIVAVDELLLLIVPLSGMLIV